MRYIQRQPDGNGGVVYYFRRLKGRRIRLPGQPGSAAFQEAYDRALALPVRAPEPKPPTKAENMVRRVERSLTNAVRNARQRARRKGLPCTIDVDWVLARARASGFRCELTGLPFYADRFTPRATRPSLDRIDSSKGYEPDNVRLVLLAINVMMADWGEETLLSIARSLTRTRTREVTAFVNQIRTLESPKQDLRALTCKKVVLRQRVKTKKNGSGGR